MDLIIRYTTCNFRKMIIPQLILQLVYSLRSGDLNFCLILRSKIDHNETCKLKVITKTIICSNGVRFRHIWWYGWGRLCQNPREGNFSQRISVQGFQCPPWLWSSCISVSLTRFCWSSLTIRRVGVQWSISNCWRRRDSNSLTSSWDFLQNEVNTKKNQTSWHSLLPVRLQWWLYVSIIINRWRYISSGSLSKLITFRRMKSIVSCPPLPPVHNHLRRVRTPEQRFHSLNSWQRLTWRRNQSWMLK